MRPHKELLVWQDAMTLVEHIYRLTSSFPDHERYGLISQLRRAAISVPSNIAEGAARRTTREYLQFLGIARGSLSEMDTQLEISRRLRLLGRAPEVDDILERIFGRINALMNSLNAKLEGRP
jgi:four helix bundle protein